MRMLPGAVWQCCYVHLLHNALDHLPPQVDDRRTYKEAAISSRLKPMQEAMVSLAVADHSALDLSADTVLGTGRVIGADRNSRC